MNLPARAFWAFARELCFSRVNHTRAPSRLLRFSSFTMSYDNRYSPLSGLHDNDLNIRVGGEPSPARDWRNRRSAFNQAFPPLSPHSRGAMHPSASWGPQTASRATPAAYLPGSSVRARVLVASPSPPRSAPYFHLWAIQLPFLYSYYLGSRDVGRNPKDSTLSTLTSDRLKYHTSVRVQTTRVLHPSIGFNT